MIFEQYELAVVEYLTDPRNSDALQNRYKWPPSIAEIREACNERKITLERLRQPVRRLTNAPYVPRPNHPGCRANVLVLREAPQYGDVATLVKTGTLAEQDWEYDPRGIRIALTVWHSLTARKRLSGFKTMSDAELRAYYGRQEAAASAAGGDVAP
jgi:hypothetical protein